MAGRPDVVAVHVSDDLAAADSLKRQWEEWEPGIELIIVESPFRSLDGPLLACIDALKDTTHPNDTLTVVLPEYVPLDWWAHLLHNQTALRLNAALLFHPGIRRGQRAVSPGKLISHTELAQCSQFFEDALLDVEPILIDEQRYLRDVACSSRDAKCLPQPQEIRSSQGNRSTARVTRCTRVHCVSPSARCSARTSTGCALRRSSEWSVLMIAPSCRRWCSESRMNTTWTSRFAGEDRVSQCDSVAAGPRRQRCTACRASLAVAASRTSIPRVERFRAR